MVTEGYVDRDNAVENYLKYFRAMDSTVAAPFIFEGIEQSLGAVTWRKFLREFHEALDAHSPYSLPAYAFGNHDQSRLATRFGSERARAAAVLQMTLPGMTFVYNGDELGMHDVHIPPEYVQDPQALAGAGRDRVRTPMQWTAAEGAGFTYGSPWLPFAHDYKTHNVATESKDPKSFLSLYRALIHLRTTKPAFRSGKLTLLHNKDPQVLAYERSSRRKRYIVVVNFQESPAILRIERHGEVIISSIDGATRKKLGGDAVHLRAHEAVVIKCS
jgi:alpha-glucosidase